MSEREVGGGCGERERDRPRRPAHETEEEGDDGGQEELGRGLPGLPEVGIDAAVSLREDPQRHLSEHDRHGDAQRAEDRPTHLVREHESERNEQARLVQGDARGIDAGEAGDDRHAAVPERERVARVQSPVLELADVVQRERAERVELADPAEVHERVAGQDVVDRPEGGAETQPGEADGEAPQPHPRRDHLPGEDPRADEKHHKRDRTDHEREGDRQVERGAEGEREREPAADERDRPGERGRHGPLPEAARQEPAGQQEDEGRGGEPQPEPEAGLGHQARDPEQRRTAHRCAERREVEPFPHRAAFGSARLFTPSQATIAAPGSAVTRVTRKKRKPVEKAWSAETPRPPRKLTKNDSRTASPLIVNGTSMTRKSSGPIT